MTLNCMIVDDDEMSRLLVSRFIEQTDFLNLTHVLDNTIEASNILVGEKNNDVDLVFLDVEMPEMTGLELSKSLKNTYPIIFITSKKEYAIEAFEDNVLDYLVKPIEYTRFLKSVIKAREEREKELKFAEMEDHIFVKSDSKLVRIPFENLFFVEALADYVIFNTLKGKFIVHHTMKGIEKRLPMSMFSRVHRSYIINRSKISNIEDFNISISDKVIPIGASYKDEFLSRVNML
ncbi:MAG: LytTR family DNA-binding domain-containing protein [Marinoscillum sp.]|uniref:LytR/AlgR family response regulator transcription factor n=2 Tax=Marinoscillum TaxID=643701 RepID=A0ABW7N4M6_9BACT|nr:LytTR family DNA-binding domain-containing protein [Marinoscillum sp. 108]VXD10453.1 DNA-binding response regulator [Marinoscillum sp. 108]